MVQPDSAESIIERVISLISWTSYLQDTRVCMEQGTVSHPKAHFSWASTHLRLPHRSLARLPVQTLMLLLSVLIVNPLDNSYTNIKDTSVETPVVAEDYPTGQFGAPFSHPTSMRVTFKLRVVYSLLCSLLRPSCKSKWSVRASSRSHDHPC